MEEKIEPESRAETLFKSAFIFGINGDLLADNLTEVEEIIDDLTGFEVVLMLIGYAYGQKTFSENALGFDTNNPDNIH